jgi:hypothetical protein
VELLYPNLNRVAPLPPIQKDIFSINLPIIYIPIVLNVSSMSPLLFSLVSFLGDGGKSASFFPFFLVGDFDRLLPDGLLDFFPFSSFLAASAALAAYNLSKGKEIQYSFNKTQYPLSLLVAMMNQNIN